MDHLYDMTSSGMLLTYYTGTQISNQIIEFQYSDDLISNYIFMNVYKGEIAEFEISKLKKELSDSSFLSVLMDGSQDISGQEQETLYVRFARHGQVKLRFLHIASPTSTASKDLLSLVDDTFNAFNIDTGTEKFCIQNYAKWYLVKHKF